LEVVHTDNTKVGSQEDYYPAGTILKAFGMNCKDFESDADLLKAVRHLCEKNKEEHGYDYPEKIDEDYAMFSRFWYVWSLGKEQTNVGSVQKKLEGDAELKDMKALTQAKVFMEGLGFDGTDPLAGSSSVKIENVKWAKLSSMIELLK
jgi:hypothetical protein